MDPAIKAVSAFSAKETTFSFLTCIGVFLCPVVSGSGIDYALRLLTFNILQVVKLHDVFPHGTGFVLVFEYMLSDLSEVIRNSDRPLTDGQVKSYMMMLLKGVAFCHHNKIMHRVWFGCAGYGSDSSKHK